MTRYPTPITRRIAPSNRNAIPKNEPIDSSPLGLLVTSEGAVENNAPAPIKVNPPNSNIIPDIMARIAIIVTPVGLFCFCVKVLE
jgi:hypothetical protein